MAHTKQFVDLAIEKGIEAWKLVLSIIKQIDFVEQAIKKESEILRPKIRQFIERTGIYVFLISLMLFTQIDWIRKHIHRYDELNIEVRLLAGFIVGVLLSLGIIELIKKIAVKTNKNSEVLLSSLAIALSPGIFFLFASKNKTFLIIGVALCILIGLYIWVKPFRDFVGSILYVSKFKNILTIEGNRAVINMHGIYEKANPGAIQSFLTDLVINLYECAEMKIKEVNINFATLIGRDENELKPIIEAVAGYFNLKIIYNTSATAITEVNKPKSKIPVLSLLLIMLFLSSLVVVSLFLSSKKNPDNNPDNLLNNSSSIITNSSFDNDTNGWAPQQSTLAVVGGGHSGNFLMITTSADEAGYAYLVVPTKVDEMYKITAYYKRGTAANGQIKVGNAIDSTNSYYSGVLSNDGWVQYSGVFKATTLTTYVTLVNLTSVKGQTSFFDSIVISKEKE